MENHSYPAVIGAPGSAAYANAPFVNTLAAQCGLATDYHNVSHPSLPNYLAATSGSTLGVTSDCQPTACPQNATSVFGQLQAAGLPWRAYDESMPANCNRGISGLYAPKRNPAVYYTDAAAACQGSDLPLGTTASGPFRSALLTNSCRRSPLSRPTCAATCTTARSRPETPGCALRCLSLRPARRTGPVRRP